MVSSFGVRVGIWRHDLGYRVQVQVSGFEIQSLRFRVQGVARVRALSSEHGYIRQSGQDFRLKSLKSLKLTLFRSAAARLGTGLRCIESCI